jgi:hypothetical protein
MITATTSPTTMERVVSSGPVWVVAVLVFVIVAPYLIDRRPLRTFANPLRPLRLAFVLFH